MGDSSFSGSLNRVSHSFQFQVGILLVATCVPASAWFSELEFGMVDGGLSQSAQRSSLPAFGFAQGIIPTISSGIHPAATGHSLMPGSPRQHLRSRPCAGVSAQLPNPFGLFGAEKSKDKEYHQSRLSHHEERIKYHEERARHHRASLQEIQRGSNSGSFEENIAQKAKQEGRPISVLFVDLSNTCRSPAAEAIMKDILKRQRLQGQLDVISCSTGSGTSDWFKDSVAPTLEPEASDPRMVSHASKRGLNLAGRRSRAMTKEDIVAADIIIGMDSQNRRDIVQAAQHWGLKGAAENKIKLLANYCRSGTRTTDIPDPYYGGQAGQPSGQVFEKVLDLLTDGCNGLLQDLAVYKA